MQRRRSGKVDFHIHSHASNVTDYYAANAFAIPESYSDPIETYQLLKKRGMSLVTLTDHNSIDGAREMLDRGLPDVFISAEMTTTFPEDGCNIHVTVANMTEAQFAEINRLRGNVYEMVAYVEQQIACEASGAGNLLAYFMTHPLMSTQNRPHGREGSLSVRHIEKALLLFPCLEAQNGSRTRALNELTRRMIESLDRETIERLANEHGIEPRGRVPWLKAIVGGSDDHSGINPARTWTEFELPGERPTANDLVRSMRRRETRPAGAHGGPITVAHSVLKLLYDGTRLAPSRTKSSLTVGGPIESLLRLVFDGDRQSAYERIVFQGKSILHKALDRHLRARRSVGEPFERVLESEVHALLGDAGFRQRLETIERTDDRIFLVVNTLLNRIFARYVDNLRRSRSSNIVGIIKELVALVSSNLFVSLPYLLSFVQQSSDSLVAREVRRAFDFAERQRVVLLTDTFFEVNGVSVSIKRMIREAIRRDLDLTVVTCLGDDEREHYLSDPELQSFIDAGKLRVFPCIARLDFPEYDDLQIRFPPFLDLLKYLQESGCTKVQLSTPGVMGLAGLAAAKALQIESAATYHTSLPEYVESYTRDISLEALAWRYMILFYHSVDEVLVPSKYIAKLLHKRGLRNRKLLILDRWVDVDRFHPRHRDETFWERRGIPREKVKLLYLGRLGVEKNLRMVAEAYRKLCATRSDCHLVLIGDGPFREEMATLLHGLPATFTGFLGGVELATAIASCDVKVFPSTTDTWGNAPLEAQASGVPVIVSDTGGPAELMVDGETGIMVGGRDVQALHAAMVALMDPETRRKMSLAARRFTEVNRVDDPFTAVLDTEAYRKRLAARSKRNAGETGPLDLSAYELRGTHAEWEALGAPVLGLA